MQCSTERVWTFIWYIMLPWDGHICHSLFVYGVRKESESTNQCGWAAVRNSQIISICQVRSNWEDPPKVLG